MYTIFACPILINSEVKVYDYCKTRPDSVIGEFYVEDKDFGDRHLKTFVMNDFVQSASSSENFAPYFE